MRQFPRLLRIGHDGCAFCPALYAFHLRVPALTEYYNGISFIRVFFNYVVYALYEWACGVNSIKPQFAALFYLLWRYAMGAYYDMAAGRYLLKRLGGYYSLCAKLIYDSKVMYELAVGVYRSAVFASLQAISMARSTPKQKPMFFAAMTFTAYPPAAL